jgi:hypothetical protein
MYSPGRLCGTWMAAACLVAFLALGSSLTGGSAQAAPLELLDSRGWEMVSPVEKNGGEVQGFGAIAGGGLLQAAANGDSATFGSASSFGTDAEGAPVASQYVARRGAGSWVTENVTLPTVADAYPEDEGVPYRLFSGDLARAVVWIGRRCVEGEPCPRSYVLRTTATGALTSLPEEPDLRFVGASPDLSHLVLSTCAALTAEATEVPGSEGCDPAFPNLYDWSGGTLRLLNILPGDSQGTPGAALAEPASSVSVDGSRVYWTDGGELYLREGSQTRWVDEAVGGGGELGAITPNGSLAFFLKAAHLYRYGAATGTAVEVDLGGAVEAPLQVSADGTRLAFVSEAPLTGYDNTDQNTGEPDSQVFLYDATAKGGLGQLACVSCNPDGVRPIGPSSIPGAIANGKGPFATRAYKPRALAAGGRRVFFDSRDALVTQDTNNDDDVYEWEAQGTGTCATPGGCVELISSGRSEDGASFVDASEGGRDVFFLTDGSLVPSDPLGTVDLYDARAGGGFPIPEDPIPCEGDACQPLPSPPEDPTPGTQVPTPGNPPVRFPPKACPKGKRPVVRKGKRHCVPKRRSGQRRQGKARPGKPRNQGGRG